MKFKSYSKSKTMSSLIFSCAIILSSAVVFSVATQSVMAAELGKTNTIETKYSSTSPAEMPKSLPVGYTKASYKVTDDTLEYYIDKKPTVKDISRDKAAELGAQYIWKVFNADLSNATIYMGYNPSSDSFPRDIWTGDVRFGNERNPGDTGYYFQIDSVTGECFSISSSRTLDVDVPLGLDSALAKNPKEFLDLATEAAKKFNLVDGEISTTEYGCQGYNVNDPTIAINVFGTNGKRAIISYSRYDKKLLAVSYDTNIKIAEAVHKKLLSETEKKVAELEKNKSNNSNNADNTSGLIAIG